MNIHIKQLFVESHGMDFEKCSKVFFDNTENCKKFLEEKKEWFKKFPEEWKIKAVLKNSEELEVFKNGELIEIFFISED